MEHLAKQLDAQRYIYDAEILTTLYVAMRLQKPLLIEGAAGVGKTEVAKVMSSALSRPLVRLQCYEGLDESKALYEWNYQKQLLAIQIRQNAGVSDSDLLAHTLFSTDYLLERPLLRAIRSTEPVVLLIDELDKADEEFEAFLLEILSEQQVTIPEMGTITAATRPFVVLTSNNTRPLSEALRRRCAYLFIPYPDIEKELRIIQARLPGIDRVLAQKVAEAVKYLRESDKVLKKPSVAETLDWLSALHELGTPALTAEDFKKTAGFILKSNDDIREIINDDGFFECIS